MWRSAGLLLVVTSGCALEPASTRDAVLADLGPVSLDMWIGSHAAWLEVRTDLEPGEPCPVLGDDFGARIGEVTLATYPGGIVEGCHFVDAYQPCIPAAPLCAGPSADLHVSLTESAVLELRDASRTIQCKLGDALAPRSATRVPDGAWEMSAGDAVTVRWAPSGDLARFAFEVSFVKPYRSEVMVSHVSEGDLVTFVVPDELEPGPHQLVITATGDLATTSKGCDVPNARSYHYGVEQPIQIR